VSGVLFHLPPVALEFEHLPLPNLGTPYARREQRDADGMWDEFQWVAEAVLPSWAGFQAPIGCCGMAAGATRFTGQATIAVKSPDPQGGAPPLEEQVLACQFLAEHEAAIGASVLEAILANYDRLRREAGLPPERLQLLAPPSVTVCGLERLIGLRTVHVLPVANDGNAYVGFEFGCAWDGARGLGVMTHRAQVVDIGCADTAFVECIARHHAERASD